MLFRFKAFCTACLLLVLTACAEPRQGGRSVYHEPSFQLPRQTTGQTSEEIPQPPPATPGQQEVQGAPRVYGVFIGISDYPGRNHDLRYCDTDAERMVQGFRDRALATTDDGLVSLTDRRASYIPVFAAFNALAHRVRDQDLFVFFFDGHGNRHEIELYDEVLQQEDVRALLGQISRGRKLLIFDSCEAGGFATAIQGMPRAAGLFAAREDEQAEIAPRLHAGGYLAYYVW